MRREIRDSEELAGPSLRAGGSKMRAEQLRRFDIDGNVQQIAGKGRLRFGCKMSAVLWLQKFAIATNIELPPRAELRRGLQCRVVRLLGVSHVVSAIPQATGKLRA